MSLFGVGLRHQHFPHLTKDPQTKIDWFEVISENFINTNGYPIEVLLKLRQNYPISMHGVSLSIGAKEEIDFDYLSKLKDLIYKVDPFLLSDHLCFTGLKNNNLHNLLPLCYDDETLNYICEKLDLIQNFLGRELSLENLSAYFSLKDSTYTEWDFLNQLTKKSGCKLLLDINNIYVNSKNQNFDPYLYLDTIDDKSISEIHLAGFSDMGTFLFDTHSAPVHNDVWDLYKYKIKTAKNVPVLIEWDEDIPDFEILELEALKAKMIWEQLHG